MQSLLGQLAQVPADRRRRHPELGRQFLDAREPVDRASRTISARRPVDPRGGITCSSS